MNQGTRKTVLKGHKTESDTLPIGTRTMNLKQGTHRLLSHAREIGQLEPRTNVTKTGFEAGNWFIAMKKERRGKEMGRIDVSKISLLNGHHSEAPLQKSDSIKNSV